MTMLFKIKNDEYDDNEGVGDDATNFTIIIIIVLLSLSVLSPYVC